jgi:hypothetical protein
MRFLAEHVKKASGRRVDDGVAGVAPEAPAGADSESLDAVEIERYARSPDSEGASTW